MEFFFKVENRNCVPIFINSHKMVCAKGWRNDFHSHPVYHIIYFSGGRGQVRLQNTVSQVQTGDLLLINPDTPHRLLADKHDPFEYSQVTFGLRSEKGATLYIPWASLLASLGVRFSSSYQSLPPEARDEINRVLAPFIEFGDNPARTPGFKQNSELLLLELLYRTAKLLEQSEKSSPADKAHNSVAETAIAYFHLHYDQKINLATAAAACGLSPSHFCREFKKGYGKTPWQALREIRLKTAAHLLKHSLFPIKEVALRTGFQNIHYFTGCFRAAFGKTPKNFILSGADNDPLRSKKH